MLENLISRMKATFFVALFLSPVMLSAWSKSLDRQLESNQRFEPLEAVDQLPQISASGISKPGNG